MAYGDFKDLPWITASDKLLRDKAFNIAKNIRYGVYQREFTSMVYKIFDKKSTLLAEISTSGVTVKIENMSNQELPKNLLKPNFMKFEKRKVHLSFIGNICGLHLDDRQLISKFYKGICSLLCAIDIFSK